ncbi:hypothetical protein GCM10010124_34840 [Pilimelia terevasa]|uniref:Putative Flp pilus-assembly TadG-like N-terminal domain-containing protein n=1 Tax=Pilimelia terevasa TaxID=53372 RepID=A0A8J3BRA2_9ACTN|nr:pilus assembly protein TadG-related protein [Pilimelia terevasa]GGK39078.1 hypothetical protein GCM10010124_34840 [Pilimelia terevasa]
MRRLTAAWRGRVRAALTGPDRDRGAAAAVVAIVAGMGLLLGMATVVVDVGRLYAEREQLVGGADAAARAVAESCATDGGACLDRAESAAAYAAANAADGAADAPVVCGRTTGLPACPADAANRAACLGEPPPSPRPYVEVRTATRMADGTTLLPGTFAAALSGGAYEGSTVGACARATWGAPRRARGLAVTFSLCEWNLMTGGGATLWMTPDAGLPPVGAERAVRLHDSQGNASCPAGPSGWDRPGGFGWLADPDKTCEAEVQADGTYQGDTGNSVSKPCKDVLPQVRADRAVSAIPIYDTVRGNGSHITYHLAGFAGFVITGYRLSGMAQASWLSNTHLCSGQERCLYGYLVRDLRAGADTEIGGPDLGLAVIDLIG